MISRLGRHSPRAVDMNKERWQEIEKLYHSARELPPEVRATYLDEACATDPMLREEVASLLAKSEQPDSFLDGPIFSLGLSLIATEQFAQLRDGQLGHYRIIKQLGRGGMGIVYLAKDERLERLVALKLLPTFGPQQTVDVMRFEQEARAASGVSHANVAHIYEIGEEEGHHFIAMEYVEGESLREWLARDSSSLRDVVVIALQVATALEAAHAAGIVHRDIKPENIIIRSDGLVKVVDFGLAKLTEPRQVAQNQDSRQTQPGARAAHTIYTQPGILMGTANYMSPEQARGQEVDVRTDIWSWGVVFYEMLVGQPPFAGATHSDIIAEILKSEPPLLRTGLPAAVRPILQRSLSKDIHARYATMSQLFSDVNKLLGQLEESGLLHLKIPLRKGPPARNEAADQAASEADSRIAHLPDTHSEIEQDSVDVAASTTVPARRAVTRGTPTLSTNDVKSAQPSMNKRAVRSPLFRYAGGLLIVALAFVVYGLIKRQVAQGVNTTGPPQLIRLTEDGHVMDAALSGDGRLLAFVTIESGQQSLWMQELESGEKWQLLPPDPALCWGLRFAQNGQSIFYIKTQPNSTIGVLYRMPVRGGQSYKLVVNIDAPPAVSPDGMQIAFVRGYPAQHRDGLNIVNVDGTSEREIASRQHPDKFSYSGAAWSPDGKLIALGVSRSNGAQFALMGVSVNGEEPVELTPWQLNAVGGVAWDNDGRTLIFSARAVGSRALQIWRLSYPNGEMQRLTQDENDYEGIILAQSGKTLLATQTYELSDIWAVDASGASRRLTTEGNEGADGLAVTPAGRIVYTVGGYEQSILWSMNMEGSDRKPLTENVGFLPSASKDGRFIAYVSSEHGNRHIWLMDTEGHRNRQLTEGGGENQPSVTPDGKWVVYTSLAQERNSLWKISTDGGQPIQLTHNVITVRPVVSPDGTMIACIYRMDETDKWKIAVLPVTGGLPLKTFSLPQPYNQIIRWTADSEALIYLDKRNGTHNLWRQPLDGSEPSQITNFFEDKILHHDLLPTGDEFILSRGGRRRNIILMKNFK